jgi:carboxyl-terminal processing protease
MAITKSMRSLIFTLIIVGLAFAPVRTAFAVTTDKSPDYKSLKLFSDVLTMVRKNYVIDVTQKKLIQGALNGMLQSLDPYSSFLTKDMLNELHDETTLKFGGLGIEVTLENGILTIVSPIEDTPAYKAGLKPGDRIIKINGKTTKNITLQKAVTLMKGPKGTQVTLTILRNGFRKFKDYTIIREIIQVQSVKEKQLEPGYPYLRITSFSEDTEKDLAADIKKLGGDEGIKGMVIDLRNNPGGLLDQAVRVSNLFLDKGLIVYTDGRTKDQRMEFRANNSTKHYKFKLAVLINGGSASASEIVTGALQDHDRAVIFGTKSFGKACVQTIIPLSDGAGLRLTTAYYYTPKGRHIQKTGIHPDVDMKTVVQKQQEKEEQAEAKAEKQKKPKSMFSNKIDLAHDPVVQKALAWLKSDVTAKQFKMDNQQKAVSDTAWYNK